jgi:transcriptional regulator with XRE-family HTH domain
MSLARAISKEEAEAITRRLTAIRLLGGDSQLDFARKLDMRKSRWKKYEEGCAISLEILYRVVKCPHLKGLTVEYILEGNGDRLPAVMRRKLRALEAELLNPDDDMSQANF